jgi:hypothetical protein
VKKRLAWALAILAILLLLAELGLRLALPNPNLQVGGMYTQEPSGIGLTPGWAGRVHTHEFDVRIRIGSNGLRDEGPPGKTVVLGDSFAFGCWSEKTWTRVMGDTLQVPVLPAGIPNSGTADELHFLQAHLAEWSPRRVVLAFFCGNDFSDNLCTWQAYRIEHGYLFMKDTWRDALWSSDALTPGPDAIPLAPFQPADRLMSPISPSWDGLSSLLSFLHPTYLYQTAAALSMARRYRNVHVHIFDPAAWLLRRYSPVMATAVRQTWQYLDALKQACGPVPLAVVVIPSAPQLYADDRQAWEKRVGLSESDLDVHRPDTFVMAWARDRKVPALNLFDALQGSTRLYYRRDMHWNEAGHRAAGLATARFIRDELSASPPPAIPGPATPIDRTRP